ncbi:MAG: hypothetical protein CMK72_01200 [Pseudomonadaceae bacterium]|nr:MULTISPECIES: hypothetical protein [Pseudomonas]MBQ53506.1 hypothetical protein [Pseudomonadaceae bacterium]OEO24035.1 hypothetical protein AX279_19570 [Pseudomonas sp. J237]HCP54560.1 hypothetical protein [Pseudomonas sp.]|tara:strand:+ start:361 stop:720 length:360 start_codon:yes stop_codon:yes gene_type:complete
MSTFAVFGMTRAIALNDAKKTTSTIRQGGGAMTPSEWEEACEKRADKIMRGAKVKQLSNLFDAPQFARQWIELQRKAGNCRDLHIRYKGVMCDALGNPIINKKTKAPKVGWSTYTEQAA